MIQPLGLSDKNNLLCTKDRSLSILFFGKPYLSIFLLLSPPPSPTKATEGRREVGMSKCLQTTSQKSLVEDISNFGNLKHIYLIKWHPNLPYFTHKWRDP